MMVIKEQQSFYTSFVGELGGNKKNGMAAIRDEMEGVYVT